MSNKHEHKEFELKSIRNLLTMTEKESTFLEKLEPEELNKLRQQIILFMQDGQKEI